MKLERSPGHGKSGGGARKRPAEGPAADPFPPAAVRRPWSATAIRMERLALEHADPNVRDCARRWLEARSAAAAG